MNAPSVPRSTTTLSRGQRLQTSPRETLVLDPTETVKALGPVGDPRMVSSAPARGAMTVEAAQRPPGGTMDAIVARSGFFQMVGPDAVAALTKHLHPVHFSCRQTVYAEGEPGDRLYIVTSGKVKIGRRCQDGRGHLLTVVGPAELFGEISIFDPGPRTSSATALTDVHAVTMHRDVFRRWIADRPEITDRLLRLLARRLRRTDNELCDLIVTDVAGRVAKQLVRLAQRFGVQENGAMRVVHDLTQEELAQLVGASRETVNKVLTDFAQRGWITLEGKSVLITDSERLLCRAG